MLGPAVNRQPGLRRGTRRAKQLREEQPCWLAGWLGGWLAGWLGLAGWCMTGWEASWLPGWLAAALLAGWLTG